MDQRSAGENDAKHLHHVCRRNALTLHILSRWLRLPSCRPFPNATVTSDSLSVRRQMSHLFFYFVASGWSLSSPVAGTSSRPWLLLSSTTCEILPELYVRYVTKSTRPDLVLASMKTLSPGRAALSSNVTAVAEAMWLRASNRGRRLQAGHCCSPAITRGFCGRNVGKNRHRKQPRK